MELEGIKKRKRGRPHQKKQIDLSKVLEIAIQSFANKGFDGTAMKGIAEEAGYTKAVLHYHFNNKETLWKESVLLLSGKLLKRYEEVKSYFKDLEGLAALKAYTRQFVYFSAENPEFYKLVFHEMCTKTERASWLLENILVPMHQSFGGENLNISEREVEFQGYPLANLSSLVIGAANVFFIHAFEMEKIHGVNPFDKEEIERHADIVIDLLFANFS